MKNNSIISKKLHKYHVLDLTDIGAITCNNFTEIAQHNHDFQIGDALYYNVKKQVFDKAIAINNVESEVCGVVSEIKDIDTFVLVTNGEIITSRYDFKVNTILYLSDARPGKLVSIGPKDIVKQIATKTTDGIMVNIQRGFKTTNNQQSSTETLEPYTEEELNEIIKNIW